MRWVIIVAGLLLAPAQSKTPIADKIVDACLWPVLSAAPHGKNYGSRLKARLDSTKACMEAVIKTSANGG